CARSNAQGYRLGRQRRSQRESGPGGSDRIARPRSIPPGPRGKPPRSVETSGDRAAWGALRDPDDVVSSIDPLRRPNSFFSSIALRSVRDDLDTFWVWRWNSGTSGTSLLSPRKRTPPAPPNALACSNRRSVVKFAHSNG